MRRTCKVCSKDFKITKEDIKFYDNFSPVFAGEKCKVPMPSECPSCRHRRRLEFRNERFLYQRRSDLSGKQIVSIYSEDKPYKVYDQDEWWSDSWDATDYALDVDYSKHFFSQLEKLILDVPHMSLYTINTENSYYTNYALNQKNCYLIYGAGDNEDCYFGKFIVYCKNCVDCLSLYSSEFCYEGIASEKCYECRYFNNCRSCQSCTFVEDMSNCSDCICCFGLRSVQYYYLNEFIGKEKYEKIKKNYKYLNQDKIAFLENKLEEIKKSKPHIASHIYHSEDCSGDSLYNCKNCLDCFDCKDCWDSKFLFFSPKVKNTYDCVFCAPDGVENCYNVCSIVNLQFCMSNFLVWNGNDIYYSMECQSSDHLFGCVGLKNKSYCIFNKQYEKEQWENIVLKIVKYMIEDGTWGEYLPINLSPFNYEETVAAEYFPKKNTQQKPNYKFQNLNKFQIPNSKDITEVKDSICEETLECIETKNKYKIMTQELDFYKKMGIPIPEKCPNQRHYNRMKKHDTCSLINRKCDNCSAEVKSIYPVDSEKIIYCEDCYLKEVY